MLKMNIHKHLTKTRYLHTGVTLLREKPNNPKGKSVSSQHWLERQFRDPYVELAKQENYRCRSAFKLIEIHEKYHIINPGFIVIDCGAAPGSWTQVAAKLANANGRELNEPKGSVFSIDKLPIYPIEGATVVGNLDFTTLEAQNHLRSLLNGTLADLVMSDMAPNASGIRELDHDCIIKLAYSAMQFALHVSRTGATFLTKVWDGRSTVQLQRDLLTFYKTVKVVRPDATRDESSETYILAKGFKGLKLNK